MLVQNLIIQIQIYNIFLTSKYRDSYHLSQMFYFLWTDPAQTKNHCKGCPPRQSSDADENALRAKKFPELRMADAQYVDGKPSGIWDHSHFADEADL